MSFVFDKFERLDQSLFLLPGSKTGNLVDDNQDDCNNDDEGNNDNDDDDNDNDDDDNDDNDGNNIDSGYNCDILIRV